MGDGWEERREVEEERLLNFEKLTRYKFVSPIKTPWEALSMLSRASRDPKGDEQLWVTNSIKCTQ